MTFLRRSFVLPVLLAFAAVLGACAGEPEPFAGYTRTPTPSVADVSLPAVDPDHAGDYEFVADEGDVLLVYFGYTSCPDVCPTTLADVRTALGNLDADVAERADLVMVTIDPEVDTPEVVTGYVQSFVPGSVAVQTLDDTLLRSAAQAFGADYGKEANAEGELEVYHTASLYAVDDQGDLVLVWSFGTPASDIASDLERLLDGERPE